MSSWDKLAEARIVEWLSRPEAERRRAPPDAGPVKALELQLLDEIVALYGAARRAVEPAEAARLEARARGEEIRLMILLEQGGRPLAARHFASLLAAAGAEVGRR